jgi:hypothetical protein
MNDLPAYLNYQPLSMVSAFDVLAFRMQIPAIFCTKREASDMAVGTT